MIAKARDAEKLVREKTVELTFQSSGYFRSETDFTFRQGLVLESNGQSNLRDFCRTAIPTSDRFYFCAFG